MIMLTRSAKVTFTIIDGNDILEEGHEVARHLWNFTWWCTVGHNRKLARQRGHRSLAGRLPKYPGNFTMQKELKDYWAAVKLSDRCFSYTVKEFDANMRSWFSNLKSNPDARPPRYSRNPRQLTFEVGRNAKHLGDWQFRLTVLGGSIPERHAVVKMHIRPGVKVKQIKLIRVRPDGTGTVVYYVPEIETPDNNLAGIDLGINNIAAVAFSNGESILYKGGAILDSDRYYHKCAKHCKPGGWHRGMKQDRKSEREKSYKRKGGNTRRLAIHNLTRSIVNECVKRGVGTIVTGNLKGIRKDKDHGKAGNQKLHAWPFAEILRQITYKAEEVGIGVIVVSERYTSKTCHLCGAIGKRVERGLFVCRDCGVEINADVNGAFNILNRGYPHMVDTEAKTRERMEKYQEELATIEDEKKLKRMEKRVMSLQDDLDDIAIWLSKVSPAPAYAGVGVGADLPGPPSLAEATPGTGKAQRLSQISPTFVAKFDLRNWSIVQTHCNRQKSEQSYLDLRELVGVAVEDSH